jgi:CubicO group peptidase (beta-lactamase class C family)
VDLDDPICGINRQTSELHGNQVPGLELVDRFLNRFARDNKLRGVCVVIVRQDRLIYARSLGYALSNEDRPLLPDTVIPLASITKFLTATGVLRLVQDGRLKLDAPFLTYLHKNLTGGLDMADARWRAVSIRNLLQMTAGIPQELAQVWKFRDRLKSRREFYQLVFSKKLAYEPGKDQAYNNCDFSILGDVIEAVSGKPWRSFVFDNTVKSCGIAKLPAYEEIGYKDASPDDWDSGAAGVACLSPLDLAKFVCEFSKTSSRTGLSLKTRELMISPPPPPFKRNADGSVQMGYYGLGLMDVRTVPEGVAFSHGGSLTNAHSFFIRQPDGHLIVGFYCGELPEDVEGSGGQWRMSNELQKVLQQVTEWPGGHSF